MPVRGLAKMRSVVGLYVLAHELLRMAVLAPQLTVLRLRVAAVRAIVEDTTGAPSVAANAAAAKNLETPGRCATTGCADGHVRAIRFSACCCRSGAPLPSS
jgi:hypothetical protein